MMQQQRFLIPCDCYYRTSSNLTEYDVVPSNGQLTGTNSIDESNIGNPTIVIEDQEAKPKHVTFSAQSRNLNTNRIQFIKGTHNILKSAKTVDDFFDNKDGKDISEKVFCYLI